MASWMGIGGVYPNYTAGFGGGSKLVLGVLGYRSIKDLHFRHRGMGWGRHEEGDPLRTDLNEIVVTAQKRSEKAQNVPISLTVLARRKCSRSPRERAPSCAARVSDSV